MVIFEGAKERRYFLGTKHTAPCGLPCLGGGVASNEPGMKDRPRRVHGWIGGAGTDQCPACAAMTPPPAGPSVGEEDEWRRGEHEVEATPPVDTSTK
jgi:hypothetical protein